MPNPISNNPNIPINLNVSPGGIAKKSSNLDFSQKLKMGTDAAISTIMGGVSAAAPFMPGGAIVSAAVNSLGGAVKTGLESGGGNLNAFGGSGGMAGLAGGGGTGGIGDMSGGTNSAAGGVSDPMNAAGGMQGMQDKQMYYLQLQMSMQASSEQFGALTNIMKVKHDTAQSAIQNIR